ncbi:hypothetical protein DIPPA_28064 [Diplonema papillatum]|nr:hypothetical protein DIPPA_28064 [Diplonema papillatum]|eukprot:gene21486-33055_t
MPESDAGTETQQEPPPCDHNDWDDVRTRKGFKILRCRMCQEKWKIANTTPRCLAFLHSCCDKGSSCPQLHVRRKKSSISERLEKFGDSVLEGVSDEVARKARTELTCEPAPEGYKAPPSTAEIATETGPSLGAYPSDYDQRGHVTVSEDAPEVHPAEEECSEQDEDWQMQGTRSLPLPNTQAGWDDQPRGAATLPPSTINFAIFQDLNEYNDLTDTTSADAETTSSSFVRPYFNWILAQATGDITNTE